MSEINVNIVETTIKSNRTPLSMLGAKMFGQDVFTPQTRLFNPDHDKVLEQAKQSSNINLVLNRSPRRFVIGYITIESLSRLIRLRLSVCLPLQQTRRSLQTTSVRRQILNQLIR